MENQDFRWKQRFQNFEKALGYLAEALEIEQPDFLEARPKEVTELAVMLTLP